MLNFKRISLALLSTLIAVTISILGLHLFPSQSIASSEEGQSTHVLAVEAQSNTEEQPVPQDLLAQQEEPRECEKIFFGAWYTEDPEWDPATRSWSCCRYVDGEPDCPDPPED